MKKILILLLTLAVLAGGWWLLRPLWVDNVVEEDFPPVVQEFNKMSQEEIDAMPEEEKMAMEKKVVEKMMEEPEIIRTEAMPATTTKTENSETNPENPSLLSNGAFQDADSFHKGSGKAQIWKQPNDSYFLRFEDFSVTNGPDLRVYLVKEENPDKTQVSNGLEVGSLKGNQGSQNYFLPKGANPEDYQSVVIYCKPFKVIFATANLSQ